MKKRDRIGIAYILAFTLTLSSITGIYAVKTPLNDIAGHWAEKYILPLYEQGIITGDHGRYEPNKKISRAEFITLIVKEMGYDYTNPSPSGFTDKTSWSTPLVDSAVEQNVLIVSEWGNMFEPNKELTRQQMAIIMSRALKLDLNGIVTNPFTENITSKEILKLADIGLINGSTENGKQYFKPQGMTTKAEASTIIVRIQEYKKDPVAFTAKEKAEQERIRLEQERLAKEQAEREEQLRINPNYGNKNVVFGEAAVAKKAELKAKYDSLKVDDPNGGGWGINEIPDPGYWVEPVFEVGKSMSTVGPAGQEREIAIGIELRLLNMIDIPKGYQSRAKIKEYPELLSKQYINGITRIIQVERHTWSTYKGTGGNGNPNGSLQAFIDYEPVFPQGVSTPYPKKGEMITFILEMRNAKEAHTYEIKAKYE